MSFGSLDQTLPSIVKILLKESYMFSMISFAFVESHSQNRFTCLHAMGSSFKLMDGAELFSEL